MLEERFTQLMMEYPFPKLNPLLEKLMVILARHAVTLLNLVRILIWGNDASILCLFRNTEYIESIGSTIDKSEFILSTDGGETFKELVQFKDKVVSRYEILKHHVIVLTQDDMYNEMSSTDIWISNDVSTFQMARTPTKIRHVNMGQIHEDSIGRIVLSVSRERDDEDSNQPGAAEVLISDSEGLKFCL
ncbi:CDA_G0031150.mRNA.1.CDS.1 [Saccharomyces cerevisiae]|nr:CDA_G0031150.mRNA.1.CDS.1 [Saccharomyces cerevisiae]CAI7371923.1 CDA_G0031150.mRNA.1.CDS.1 [Saccharomyces cerevisiae]